ncbi:hypothetical protein [Chitinophaga sp. sic0106]|uniref:hypothetical protein n=1 Tax=Chitinophaga sp. sic0106 TaxID=2854785 RepID=UPI001C48CFE6|nr:hypothetical protein [Chitinophaga sp. sic0106]MBV7530907.1 hypothetical protein [Chitinophaga sp. sic0106]
MRIMLLLAAAIFITACGNNPGASRQPPKTLADTLFSFMIKDLAKYTMLEDVNFPDSNELYFTYEQGFDTARLIHIRKRDSVIRVRVYQVHPPRHDDGKIEAGLLPQFFEGISFNLSPKKWEGIRIGAECILLAPSGHRDKYQPFDASTYILAFNSNIKGNYNEEETVEFEAFLDYLKQEVLYEIQTKRPPPGPYPVAQ